ncbi:MAG: alpha/beta hydrolase [Rhodospirillales bacterium]|nr:alpha/beta hydrolase [Rhodospirillales bacterium]
MLLMVTSRKLRNGKYGNDEQANFGFDYLYNYNNGERGRDSFLGKGKRGFEASLLAELRRLKNEVGINTPKIGIYLHGYNNDWQQGIDEIFDLHNTFRESMGYEPIIVGFSWPSMGETRAYLTDREEARQSAPAFVRFLRDINDFAHRHEQDCFSTTYCIAHSMGNYLLRKGMEYLSDHLGSPMGRSLFTETVMLAPDIASKDIELDGKGRYISHFSRRVHVYYSKHDRALKASSAKRFGGDRLGRHGAKDYGNVASNIAFINAEIYASSSGIDGTLDREGEQVSVHSSHRYQGNIVADIIQVLSSVDRDTIPNRYPVIDPDAPRPGKTNHFKLD